MQWAFFPFTDSTIIIVEDLFVICYLFVCLYFIFFYFKCHQEKHKNVHKDDSYNRPILPHQKPPVSSHMAGVKQPTVKSLSILPNKHLGPRPISYCFITLYCEGRDADPFLKYILALTYHKASLHSCLLLQHMTSWIIFIFKHLSLLFIERF